MGESRARFWAPPASKAIAWPLAAVLGLAVLTPVTDVAQAVASDSGAGSTSVDSRPQRRGRTNYSQVIRELKADIPALMDQNKVVGLTIALVDGQRVVWKKGFGYANKARGRRVNTGTLFPIGSVSKTFTAAAVMQLVERGWVNLDDPLSKYVPGFRLKPRFAGNVITVRSVLDHHSGIPGNVFNGLITSRRPDPGFRPWLLRALRKMYPERRVNKVWSYSNSAYVLLQNLVEHVSGMKFERYAQRHLFGPMGMKSSHFDPTRAPVRRLTRGYLATYSPEGQPIGAKVQAREYVNGWSAGSITSSATDMSRYMRTMLARGKALPLPASSRQVGVPPGGRVLRRSTVRQMWTPQTHTTLDNQAKHESFGLGWHLRSPDMEWAGKSRSHDGATVFAFSSMRLLPDSGLGVFVSVNTSSTGGLSASVSHEALSLAYTAKTGIPEPPPAQLPNPRTAAWSQAALRRHAGLYAGGNTLTSMTVAGGNLVSNNGAAVITYTPTRSGWLKPDQAGVPQIRFRKVAGRRLLLARLPSGPAIMRGPLGERISPSRLRGRWRHKLGNYRATNINPRQTPFIVPERVALSSVAGVLTLVTGLEGLGVQALKPVSGKVAFTAGLGFGLARGKGDSVVFRKRRARPRSFTYLGVRYVRRGPAAESLSTPPAPTPSPVNPAPLDWWTPADSWL
ncbi:MAG: serine hydrolase domain-containing protein [Candidatus Nanopelagicales bacterium]|nr:serine hydrolase domain-containing protein [Candidatus Nanopelagicales bacterium]MDZ4248471.1 serine hydrolase domain-containing protein [Candidatus Nanopelagicales bacterium]